MSELAGEEGIAMENKKSSTRPSSVPRSNGAESKGKTAYTDSGNSKRSQFNKKREGSNSKPRHVSDTSPRPRPAGPPKKAFDKRPRSRGYQGNRQRQEVVTDEPVGLDSGLTQNGSKKGNLNHLLNFTFAPREGAVSGSGGGGGGWGGYRRSGQWRGYNRWGGSTGVRFNKEQFLQANCQFVVKETGDYAKHSADPDTLVDWGAIEQIRLFCHEVPSCPICLYPPTAAKITRCGHIYCWKCILHYLSLQEKKTWGKCPICFEIIDQNDLKSVSTVETHAYGPEERITMKLMKRERGSTYAMPYSQWTNRDGKPYGVDDDVDTSYSKLLVASPHHMQSILEEEQTALEVQMADEGAQTLEGSFVQLAMDMLKERRGVLNIKQKADDEIDAQLRKLQLDEIQEEHEEHVDVGVKFTVGKEDAIQYASAFDDEIEVTTPSADAGEMVESIPSDEASCETVEITDGSDENRHLDQQEMDNMEMTLECDVEEVAELLAVPAATPAPAQSGLTPKGPTMIYYYYQAADGQHIYLNALNARCLLREYGDWENCPDTITANIIEIEGVTMNADIRKRLRYLSHLPLCCEFTVAELALEPPLVSRVTLQEFAADIDKRKKMRQRKLQEDRRISRRMEREENRKLGFGPGMRLSIGSSRHFPEYNTSHSQARQEDVPSVSPRNSGSMASSSSSTPVGSPPSQLNPTAPTFVPGASMTAATAQVASSPCSETSEDGGQAMSLSFAQMLRAGKTKPSVPSFPRASHSEPCLQSMVRLRHTSESGSDSEDRVPVPTYQSSFGDAIQEALDNYQVNKDEETNVTPVSGGKKKKKKKEKMVLFSTSMARTK